MESWAKLLLSVVLLVVCLADAQGPRTHYDPAPAHRAGQQKSFIDWTFSQINPRNIDYGARIELSRQSLLDDTLRDPDFLSKALLIAALCGLFIAYWWECRTTGGLRVSTSRIIAAYHNELAATRDHVTQLTAEYAQAKRILEDQMEAGLAAQAAVGKRQDGAANGSKKELPAATSGNGQPRVDELLVENNSLKRQVKTLTTKWEEEQQRNRKLKGE